MLAIVLVLQSLSTPAAPSCAGPNHNSHKLPSAVLLNMTDPSVIAVLEAALVNVLGRMVPMWERFMFLRAVVREPASAAFPFSKTLKIYLPDASWVCFSLFYITIPRKLPWLGFFHLPSPLSVVSPYLSPELSSPLAILVVLLFLLPSWMCRQL